MSLSLAESIGIKKHSMVSIVGAGGKTSLMYQLANELSQKGFSCLITSSTKIFHPSVEGRTGIDIKIGKPEELISTRLPKNSIITVAGSENDFKESKIIGFLPEQLDHINERKVFDFIFVEADGAKGKSIKAPASHEPVIPNSSHTVVGVIGLSCLGKPLNSKYVHRPELLSAICGQRLEEKISEDTIVKLVRSSKGLFKGASDQMVKTLVLNQLEGDGLLNRGVSIADEILTAGGEAIGINKILLCSLLEKLVYEEIDFTKSMKDGL